MVDIDVCKAILNTFLVACLWHYGTVTYFINFYFTDKPSSAVVRQNRASVLRQNASSTNKRKFSLSIATSISPNSKRSSRTDEGLRILYSLTKQ